MNEPFVFCPECENFKYKQGQRVFGENGHIPCDTCHTQDYGSSSENNPPSEFIKKG